MRGSLRSPSQFKGTHTSSHNSRNNLRLPLPCELRPDSPAVTQEHSRTHPHNPSGHLTSLSQHKGRPEFPVITREKPQTSSHNLRQTTRFPRQREMRPFSAAPPREQSQVPSKNWRGGWTNFNKSRGPGVPVPTRDEGRVSHHKSRRVPCFPPHWEMRAHSLLQLKRNPNFSSYN